MFLNLGQVCGCIELLIPAALRIASQLSPFESGQRLFYVVCEALSDRRRRLGSLRAFSRQRARPRILWLLRKSGAPPTPAGAARLCFAFSFLGRPPLVLAVFAARGR